MEDESESRSGKEERREEDEIKLVTKVARGTGYGAREVGGGMVRRLIGRLEGREVGAEGQDGR